MAPTKRPRSEDANPTSPPTKKHRSGFKVGPDNLPDGTWRRKVIAIKKDLIHKAKVKKSYAKLLAKEPVKDGGRNVYDNVEGEDDGATREGKEATTQELHPDRQAMLDAPEPDQANANGERRGDRRRGKPAYFAKEIAHAEEEKAKQKAKRDEFERRDKERKARIKERERFRRQMAKARSGGRDGKRKLGRESKVLLEKVMKVVGE